MTLQRIPVFLFFMNKRKQNYLMFDPFTNSTYKPPSKTSVDYHNAKYHGNVQQQQPHGLGLLLDHHYMLAISSWQHTRASGPTTIIYPDSTLFQGNIQQSIPEGFCTYFPRSNIQIFSQFTREDGIYLAIDSRQISTLYFLKIDKPIVQILMRETDENRLLSEYRKNENQAVRLMDQKKYVSEGSRIDFLRQYFKREVKEPNISFKTYIMENFTGERLNEEVLEVTDSKEEFGFGFKSSSIICKIGRDAPLTVKALGYYNHVSNSFQISRKDKNSGSIQQSIGSLVFQYPKMPQQRPHQSLSLLHKYYKQSLDFQNKNFNVDYLYRVKFIFEAVQRLFSQICTLYQAQQLLENPKKKEEVVRQNRQRSPYREEFSYYPIDQVCQDIYEAVNRRKSQGSPRYRSSSQKKLKVKNYSPNSTYIYNRHLDHTASKVNKSHFIYPRILQKQSRVNHQKGMNQKHNYPTLETTLLFEKSKRRSPLSKYAYLEQESEKINQKKIKQMKTLTQYYEDIQRETRNKYSYQTPIKTSHKNSISNKGTKESDLSGSKGPKRRLIYGWD